MGNLYYRRLGPLPKNPCPHPLAKEREGAGRRTRGRERTRRKRRAPLPRNETPHLKGCNPLHLVVARASSSCVRIRAWERQHPESATPVIARLPGFSLSTIPIIYIIGTVTICDSCYLFSLCKYLFLASSGRNWQTALPSPPDPLSHNPCKNFKSL